MTRLDDNENSKSTSENDENSNVCFPENYEKTKATVDIARSVFTKNLNTKDDQRINYASIKSSCRASVSKNCRVQTLAKSILSLFPVLTWLPAYPWRTDLLPDFLAGLTVGIMSIPQGMAYARLAGMPPVYGLYTNIIPTFVYFLLGTTKHAAIGPATVLSLIMSSIRYKHIPCQDCWMYASNITNHSINNPTGLLDLEPGLTPIQLGTAVAFLAGAFLVIMGILRLSFVADYLPDQLVGGFTVAAAVQVFSGQLPSIFGISLPNRNGIGKVILNFFDLFSLITRTNVATLVVFLVCFVFLLFSKHVINSRFQPKFKLPFPGEFLVMVAATLASYYANFYGRYDVSIVQHITSGLPKPEVPKTSIMGTLAADSLVLAIVTYSYSISLAKLYAKRNGYRIHSTQEFYAYGMMNFVGSFFQCFNSGQSVARSLVYEMSGAKSQLCGMFGSMVVILTVLFIAPFLESLPNAALAAIIVTAIVEMLRNLRALPNLFRSSKYDFFIYLVTLISVIVLDVTYGLAVSVAFALVTVIFRSQRAKVESVKEENRLLYSSDELYEDVKKVEHGDNDSLWSKIKIIRLTSPLFYVNAERVKNRLLENFVFGSNGESRLTHFKLNSIEPIKTIQTADSIQTSTIILDMTAVSFTDLMGINALKEACLKMKDKGISLYICGCTASVEDLMKNTGFLQNCEAILFPTVLDAVSYARCISLNIVDQVHPSDTRTTLVSEF